MKPKYKVGQKVLYDNIIISDRDFRVKRFGRIKLIMTDGYCEDNLPIIISWYPSIFPTNNNAWEGLYFLKELNRMFYSGELTFVIDKNIVCKRLSK